MIDINTYLVQYAKVLAMNPKLEAIYSQIPRSTCSPECGECCGILWPSLAELRNIQGWCEAHHVEYRDFNMTVGLDCPYMGTDKSCTIYPVRPFLCRIMGVSVDIPCPLGKCKPNRMLNHPQSSAMYKAIYLQGKEKPRTEKYQQLVRRIFQEVLSP